VPGDDRRAPDDGRSAADDDRPVLPDVSRDETAEGWGEPPDARDDDWYRRERPPHWD
jgi:hypothetical protein